MAVQGIWSGTISFSLVAIPVRLVAAVRPGRVSFHLLHSKDYSRLTRRMFCPEEEAMVPPDEVIRGYEIVPGKYVLMTDEELESVSPERSRTIEIVEFIDLKEVDPIYFDHPYYLIPSKGGEKAYQLLVEVMRRTNKAGLAKFVLAEREYLVAVTSRDGALELTTLHYSDEILPDEDISPKKGKVEAEEESRMKKNIEHMIEDFNPGKYADGRLKKIMDLLATKAREKALVEAPAIEEEEGEGPADLVAALEESMRKVKESR
ncbi:MAG: Ku protein [Betaproteobacteria bacterium]